MSERNTILNIAKDCGEQTIEDLEAKNLEIRKAMDEMGIPVLDKVKANELFNFLEIKG